VHLFVLARRLRPAHAALVAVAAVSGFGTWGLFRPARAPRPSPVPVRSAQPIAPGAARVVTSYLQALQSGNRETACRLFYLQSVCSSKRVLVGQFTVRPAEVVVDGFQVAVTVNGQNALFELAGRPGRYRIVDIVADPASPALMPTGYFA
jgi:hypothetical protein